MSEVIVSHTETDVVVTTGDFNLIVIKEDLQPKLFFKTKEIHIDNLIEVHCDDTIYIHNVKENKAIVYFFFFIVDNEKYMTDFIEELTENKTIDLYV